LPPILSVVVVAVVAVVVIVVVVAVVVVVVVVCTSYVMPCGTMNWFAPNAATCVCSPKEVSSTVVCNVAYCL
jgi:hypothetical protein